MMWVNFYIAISSVGGTPDATLLLKIPAGKTCVKTTVNTYMSNDNAAGWAVGYTYIPSGTWIWLERNLAQDDWTASTNTTGVAGSVTFEIA